LGRLEAPPEQQHQSAAPPVPDDHVLVPLDAWEKMLLQLGNLHEAGRDLADARERAAKAETEAQFLRERVAYLREERDLLREEAATVPPPATEPPPEPAPATASWTDRYRKAVRAVRRRRRR
jgi:hypothetical protein